ncbi:hypothetical protein [Flavobacterium microcysteis]
MSGFDLKLIEENYARMSDAELERIATTDSQGLRPEVYQIIENEIKKRNLSPNLASGVKAQNKEYTIEELETYSKLLRELSCLVCGNHREQLNGTASHTVKSFVFVTSYRTKITIACESCLDKKNNDAIRSTALLGWWGIPWGVLKTPVYIYRNVQAKKENKLKKPNNALLSFTLGNIGEIETYKDDKEKLKQIISRNF